MAPRKSETATEREKRLAKALRENLKKRKAQSRDKMKAEGEGDTPAAKGKVVNKERD